jgi:cell division protein ZipA
MIVIGALLILAVLLDAIRRVVRERRSEVRLNAKIKKAGTDSESDEPFDILSELPNGGARIVRRGDLRSAEMPDQTAAAPIGTEYDQDVDGDGGEGGDAAPVEPDSSEPVIAAESQSSSPKERPSLKSPNVSMGAAAQEDDGLVQGLSSLEPEEPENLDWLEELGPEEPPIAIEEAKLPRDTDPHVFILHVISRDPEGFRGKDILHILLACDLRFGDMDFFHRHEQPSGRGPIQFSVANMMKPGVFDIDAMDELQTRGLMFFVTLPGPEDMLQAFNYMYETARAVAKNLNGDVYDETRSVLNTQSLEHMRQQIRELERRLLIASRRP